MYVYIYIHMYIHRYVFCQSVAILAQVAVEQFVEIAMPSQAVDSRFLPPLNSWVEIISYQVFVVDPLGRASPSRIIRLRCNTGQGATVLVSVLFLSATLFTPEQPTTRPP